MNTAIITGASAGIGASAASLFTQRNFKVINLSRRPCKVEGVLNLCGDLASEENLENILPRVNEAISQSDSVSLVHNAAKMLSLIHISEPTRLRRSRMPSSA